MKSLSLLSLFFISTIAFAETASLNVGSFSGELIAPQNVTIENIIVEAHIQHCNRWGSGCAEGPGETKIRKASFTLITENNLIDVKSPSQIDVYSNILGNKFSFCSVSLVITASTPTKQNVEGYVNLVYEEDKKICASPSQLKKMIDEKFTTPQPIDFWNL